MFEHLRAEVPEPIAAPAIDATQIDATQIDAWSQALAAGSVSLPDASLVDLLTALERLKSAAAAAQARATVALAESQAATHPHHDLAQLEASVGAQVGLARRTSPFRGRAALRLARVLSRDLPFTFDALAAGEITEWQATLVARETTVLSATDRRQVDRELAGRLGPMGDRRIATQTRHIADRLDPEAALHRLAGAESDRRVGIRPIKDGMVQLSAQLPLVAGISAYATLRAHAMSSKNAGDPRGIGQIMADELCLRLAATRDDSVASGPDLAVNLIMTDHGLLTSDPSPATVMGSDGAYYGSIPGFLARRLVRTADKAWIRRLYAAPTSGELVAMETRARVFTGRMRDLVVWRDQTCRTPWCEAPIRHLDHIHPHAAGGTTSIANAQGLCEACNQLKELPGWHTRALDPGGGNITEITTPTGHRHRSKAPPQLILSRGHLIHHADDHVA